MKEQLLAWLRTEVLGRRQPDANMRALLAHAASVWGIPAEGANVLLFEWRNKLSHHWKNALACGPDQSGPT